MRNLIMNFIKFSFIIGSVIGILLQSEVFAVIKYGQLPEVTAEAVSDRNVIFCSNDSALPDSARVVVIATSIEVINLKDVGFDIGMPQSKTQKVTPIPVYKGWLGVSALKIDRWYASHHETILRYIKRYDLKTGYVLEEVVFTYSDNELVQKEKVKYEYDQYGNLREKIVYVYDGFGNCLSTQKSYDFVEPIKNDSLRAGSTGQTNPILLGILTVAQSEACVIKIKGIVSKLNKIGIPTSCVACDAEFEKEIKVKESKPIILK